MSFNEVLCAKFHSLFQIARSACDNSGSTGTSEDSARRQHITVRSRGSALLHLGYVEQPDRHTCPAVSQRIQSVTVAGANGAIGRLLWLFLHGVAGGFADAAVGI
jgi:hypothetical protein